MSDRRNGAFFFLLRQESMPSLDELATAAGVTSLSRWPWPEEEEEEEDMRLGCWGGVISVEARLRHLDLHDCLVLDFWESSFLDLLPPLEGNEELPLEEDGALPVALAFRGACERLRPEAAVLATHPHMLQDPQWLHACYSAVLGMDPNSLDSQGAAITYVCSDMVDEWAPENFGPPERDSLPVTNGRLLFRATGWSRWS
jgi:hypothetical protein